ncbi:MAG: GNAT family N-acetyltransferase [Actinomycetota bacterium]|nr:GNAT family N-acetyltransferase [Actinomycetota bacterium]
MPLPLRLETARLILRPLGWDDLAQLTELHAEASFWWFPKHRAMSARETRLFMERTLERYETDGVGLSAAVIKESGDLAGWLGLAVPHFLPEILPAVEVGWRLGERYRGHGYATEGAAAAIRYGFETVGLDRLVSIFQLANVTSGRVMDKLGFEFERETHHPLGGEMLQVRELTKNKWVAAT